MLSTSEDIGIGTENLFALSTTPKIRPPCIFDRNAILRNRQRKGVPPENISRIRAP
jgi:hypothetical protein